MNHLKNTTNYINANALHLKLLCLCDNMEVDHKQQLYILAYDGHLGEKFCRECWNC